MNRIDFAGDSIIMRISISDFPSNGIIYTADAVMFHRDAIERWLPECTDNRCRVYGHSFETLYELYSKESPMMDVNQLRELISNWWRNQSKCSGLADSIAGSAIAYKPAEKPHLYLFSGNGGFYVVQGTDPMEYLDLVQRHKLRFDRAPIARMRDHNREYELDPDLKHRLAQAGIKLVSRGYSIWLAIGPADGMQEKLIAAFTPPPVIPSAAEAV